MADKPKPGDVTYVDAGPNFLDESGPKPYYRLWTDIQKDLCQEIDSRYIKNKEINKRAGGSFDITYIPWHYLCEILDTICPGWEWSINDIKYNAVPEKGQYGTQFAGSFYLIGTLTIWGHDGKGNLTSRNVSAGACEQISSKGYGDPMTNASASALRRACGTLGIARYLWNKDRKSSGGWQRQQQQAFHQKPQQTNTGYYDAFSGGDHSF